MNHLYFIIKAFVISIRFISNSHYHNSDLNNLLLQPMPIVIVNSYDPVWVLFPTGLSYVCCPGVASKMGAG